MLILNENLKSEFKKPLGKLYPNFEDAVDSIDSSEFLFSVGDMTTNNLIKHGLSPNIGIIDNIIQRKAHDHDLNYTNNILKVNNPPGTITNDLWETINIAIDNAVNGNKQLIVVDGEEDLAVLPCIIMAPENSIILYGQPNEGLVFVDVSNVKNKANKLLKLLKTSDKES